jgi:hypothetical protein
MVSALHSLGGKESSSRELRIGSGVLAHVCNPKLAGDGDEEDQGSRPTQAKELTRYHLNQ